MPRDYVAKGLRAAKGTVAHSVRVQLEPTTAKLLAAQAKRSTAGNISEWIRQAITERLERDTR